MKDCKDEIEVNQSPRGFYNLDEVDTTYGTKIRIHESSAADGPHIWLTLEQPPMTALNKSNANEHMSAHMDLDQAVAVRDRLSKMIEIMGDRFEDEDESS